jgi:hypothetical protein
MLKNKMSGDFFLLLLVLASVFILCFSFWLKTYKELKRIVCKPCGFVVDEGVKVFEIKNENTIVIYNGQRYFFNESIHKTRKTKDRPPLDDKKTK